MPEVFSNAWAAACARELNGRPAYQAAAATWEGAVVLQMSGGDIDVPDRAVFLDLWHGQCRTARAAAPGDLDMAAYVLAGTIDAWRGVLEGRTAPLLAIMSGKLRITKGSLAGLAPYIGAAKELVAAATAVETDFPEGGTD
ncbi:MAG: SCP2 sterol-binding domain-containing protein [Gemmatimonadota bacterium]